MTTDLLEYPPLPSERLADIDCRRRLRLFRLWLSVWYAMWGVTFFWMQSRLSGLSFGLFAPLEMAFTIWAVLSVPFLPLASAGCLALSVYGRAGVCRAALRFVLELCWFVSILSGKGADALFEYRWRQSEAALLQVVIATQQRGRGSETPIKAGMFYVERTELLEEGIVRLEFKRGFFREYEELYYAPQGELDSFTPGVYPRGAHHSIRRNWFHDYYILYD